MGAAKIRIRSLKAAMEEREKNGIKYIRMTIRRMNEGILQRK